MAAAFSKIIRVHSRLKVFGFDFVLLLLLFLPFAFAC